MILSRTPHAGGRSIACAALVATAAALALPPPAPAAADRDRQPALIVMLVVDQMRADYVDRFEADWKGGLARLVRQGARFTNAAFPYLNTFTCAGHATVATGTLPYHHGMVQNTWYDRDRKAVIPCTDDAGARGVGYSDRPRDHIGPGRLLVPTLADVLRETRGARVVSMSLKARSAIMLAGHGGHAVTWLGEAPDNWQTSSVFSTSPVPAVKSFLETHPIDADAGRVWTRLLPADRYRDPDEGEGETPITGWTRTFPHRLGGLAAATPAILRTQWETSPIADERLAELAMRLVETEKLGQRDTTDALLLSFSSTDLVGHRFGPRSQEVQDMYAHLDRTLGRLFDRLDRLVGRRRYVVALSADHGVAEIVAQAQKRGEDAGRLTTAEVAKTVETAAQASLGPGRYVARVNGNDIYFEPGVYARLKAHTSALNAISAALAQQPGIARVFRSDELAGGSQSADPLQRAAALSFVEARSGDLVVALKHGWMFSTLATTHGTAHAYDQRVPLLLWGAGIKPGRYDEPATPADIAPTLAVIAGVTLPRTDGRVLTSAMQASAAAGAPTR